MVLEGDADEDQRKGTPNLERGVAVERARMLPSPTKGFILSPTLLLQLLLLPLLLPIVSRARATRPSSSTELALTVMPAESASRSSSSLLHGLS